MSQDPHSNGHENGHQAVDAWHRHTLGEGDPQREHGSRVQPGKIFVIGTIHLALFVVAVVVVILYFNYTITKARSEISETTEPANEWYAYYNESKSRNQSFGVDSASEDARIPVLLRGETPTGDAAAIVIERYREQGQ